MEYRKTLAVVDDTRFFHAPKIEIGHGGFSSLEALLEHAGEVGITHLWLMPNTNVASLCAPVDGISGWNARAPEKIGYGSYMRGDTRIQIGTPKMWPWEVSSPRELLQTVCCLENTLGLDLEWTPAHMALETIRQKNAGRWSWLAPLTIDLEEKTDSFRYSAVAKEILKSDWRGAAGSGKYRIKIDGNSRYGATMTGVSLGEGDPDWTDTPERDYDGKRPGFWRCKVDTWRSPWNGHRLPSFEDRIWLTTDLVKQFRESGMLVEVFCGWFWGEKDGKKRYHQTLRSTISNPEKTGLWDLRLHWREKRKVCPANENVYESISAILHTVHGKLGDSDLFQRRFYRPDMWAMVVAGSVARMMYWIEKIYRDFGLLPCRIHVDGLEYSVDNPNVFDSILDANKLGGFKLVSVREWTEEERAGWV